MEEILTERRGGLGVLTLNRPRALNALSHGMVLAMERALRAWAEDSAVHGVLVRGAGERGLCAGGDVRALFSGSDEDAVAYWTDEYRLNALIASYPKLYVAVMDGVTMGGGLGISAHGSLRIVTEQSSLAMPETRIGFTPDVGMASLLVSAPGELGTYVALTSSTMTGADAIAVGWADLMIPTGRLERLIESIAGAKSPEELARRALGHAVDPGPSALRAQRGWIDAAFEGDSVEGIEERLLSFADSEAEAAVALETMRALCPFSLVVTLKALRRAQGMALSEVLEQDLVLGAALIARSDFREGVRALLVDKDGAPRWSPAAVAEVDAAEVRAAFRR